MKAVVAVAGNGSMLAGAAASSKASMRLASIVCSWPGALLRPGRMGSAVGRADVMRIQHFARARSDAFAALVILDTHERLDAGVHDIPRPHRTQERRRFSGA